MSSLFGLYGASGCGRGIMPLARESLGASPTARLVFIDDALAGQRLNGHEVMDFDTFCREPADKRHVAVAIANPSTRAAVVLKCADAGLDFFGVAATNCVRMDEVEVGTGALISPFVTLTSNIRIGRHFHANLYSYVEHDCVIGDFVTFAPAVRCNGNVHIEDGVYVGAGALIRQGKPEAPLRIGAGAVIGMGAVVTKDVPAGADRMS